MQTLSRLYTTQGQATGAVNQLVYNRFSAETIFVFGPPGSRGAGALAEGATTDDITTAIMRAYVLKSHARIYADCVAGGAILVVVHAALVRAAHAGADQKLEPAGPDAGFLDGVQHPHPARRHPPL